MTRCAGSKKRLCLLLENDKQLWYRKQVASLFKLENAKNSFIQQHVIFR